MLLLWGYTHLHVQDTIIVNQVTQVLVTPLLFFFLCLVTSNFGSSSATCNTALGLLLYTRALDNESATVLAEPGWYCKCRRLELLRYQQHHQASIPKQKHSQALCGQYYSFNKTVPQYVSVAQNIHLHKQVQ